VNENPVLTHERLRSITLLVESSIASSVIVWEVAPRDAQRHSLITKELILIQLLRG